ncbi:FK506-binding protein 5-like [Schistocerca gregaria]|uniref:FK506-binding protein 5-like n=1 Tax=Schistocerca gregaria TaxID=7010 RepID=UPI00211E15E5|nr:FK506-binding protein 5-like [Schistocerca gregaria]
MVEEIELGYRTLKWLETLESNQIPENVLPHMRNIVANIVDFQNGFSLPYSYGENNHKDVKLLKMFQPYRALVKFGVAYPVDSSNIKDIDADQDSYVFDNSTQEVACIAGSKAWKLEVEAGRIVGKDAIPPILESFEWIQNLFAVLASENLSDAQKKEARSLASIWYYIATLISFDGEKGEDLSKSKIIEMISSTFKCQKNLAVFKEKRAKKLNDARYDQDVVQEKTDKIEGLKTKKRGKKNPMKRYSTIDKDFIEEANSNEKEEEKEKKDCAQCHDKYTSIDKLEQKGLPSDIRATESYTEREKKKDSALSDSDETKLGKFEYKSLHLSKGSYIGEDDNSDDIDEEDDEDDYMDEEDEEYIDEEDEEYIDEEEEYIDEDDEDYIDEDDDDYTDEDDDDYTDEYDDDYTDECDDDYTDEDDIEYLCKQGYENSQVQEKGKPSVECKCDNQKVSKVFEIDRLSDKSSEDKRLKTFREYVLSCVEKLNAQLPSVEDGVWLDRTLKMMSIAECDELAWYPWGIPPLLPLKMSTKSEDAAEREHAIKLLSSLKIAGYEPSGKEEQIQA